jgi:O-antigen biosynthesis protein
MPEKTSLPFKIMRALQQRGPLSLLKSALKKLRHSSLGKALFGPTGPWSAWLNHYLPKKELLEQFRNTQWPVNKPKFSILMPVYNTNTQWLQQAIDSVKSQTYQDWELWCIDDHSTHLQVPFVLKNIEQADKRIHAIILDQNQGVSAATNTALNLASGTHVLFMDHDDYLEPHALHRFAQAIIETDADLLYADEALTSEDLNHVHQIKTCPAFSHDYYLSHPYVVHPICARTSLAKATGGLNTSLKVSHDVDMFLRLIEKANTIAHIPDVLYRWRLHLSNTSHSDNLFEITKSTMGALERHLKRLDINAKVSPSALHHNFFRIDHPLNPKTKVAILIPTKNRSDLLQGCLDSLRKTVPPELIDIIIIDHESDDVATRELLKREEKNCTITPYGGPFNFATMMNNNVNILPFEKYTHYLFLNNDIIATEKGWLENMLCLFYSNKTGAVGANLLYPDMTIQHSGVIIGLAGPAAHAHRFFPISSKGIEGSIHCNRDYSAVTAACMVVSREAFKSVNGFDKNFAIGYNDTDLCLRMRNSGYKILQAAGSILFHLESQSRGISNIDGHPADTKRFIDRYASFIKSGDPYYSPYLDNEGFSHLPKPGAKCPLDIPSRLVTTPWIPSKQLQKKGAA